MDYDFKQDVFVVKRASREYLKKACHSVTGLCAEYAEYDGTPRREEHVGGQRHDWYYSDAYRTVANIGLDYLWFAADEWECKNAENVQKRLSPQTPRVRWPPKAPVPQRV